MMYVLCCCLYAVYNVLTAPEGTYLCVCVRACVRACVCVCARAHLYVCLVVQIHIIVKCCVLLSVLLC